MRRGTLLGFMLGILAAPVWSDIHDDVAHLKAKLVLGTASEIVDAFRDEERLARIRKDPEQVRELCTWAAECAAVYTGPVFAGDARPIVASVRRLIASSNDGVGDHRIPWAKAEIGVLQARIERRVSQLVENALDIANRGRRTDDEARGLLRCIELHLEALHAHGADAPAIIEALRDFRERANGLDFATRAAAEAAVRLESPPEPFRGIEDLRKVRDESLRYRIYLAASANLDLVRRHNDMINRGPTNLEHVVHAIVRSNQRWRPSGGWNNDGDFYTPTRRKLHGLAFAFPLSRNWRMFPIERPGGRRLCRFQSVTNGGVGTGHIEIESVQEDGKPALTQEQLDERFLQELTAFEFSRGLCTLRPTAIELGRDLPEVHAYAMWGWRRDGTFCRQRIWMFSANGYQVRCRSVEFRDELFVPELAALLASLRVK